MGNVFKLGENDFRAMKMVKGVRLQPRGKTARQAARRLNSKCLELKAKLPNPKVGCEDLNSYDTKGGRPKNILVKTETLYHCGIKILADWRCCPKCCSLVTEIKGHR